MDNSNVSLSIFFQFETDLKQDLTASFVEPGMKFVLRWAHHMNNTTLPNIQKVKFAHCKRED